MASKLTLTDMTQDERWLANNGNICFRFEEKKVFERPWIIVLAAFLLIVVTGIEYLVYGSYYSLTPNVILFFLLFLWWTTIPLKANETIIEKTVHELMDDTVAADAKAAGTEVTKSFVHYDVKGTYAIITGRCFLVLLKNGIVWEYPIKYHKPNKKAKGFYECNKNYIVSKDQEHIRAIRPRLWHSFMAKLKLSDKAKLWLIIFAILLIGGVALTGVYWLITGVKWWSLLFIGGYFVLYEITERVSRLLPGKIMETCKNIVSLPIFFLYVLTASVQPFITIVGTCLFIGVFAFGIPALILTGINHMGWIILNPETIAFIDISLGSVLCSMYPVTKWIVRHSPLKNLGNHDYEANREQLALYLAHPSNIVFLLYLAYFVILAVSGYMLIQNNCYMVSESFDMAVIKAFLVFIAFTNMRVKAKETEVDAKVLLKRISGLFVHDKY